MPSAPRRTPKRRTPSRNAGRRTRRSRVIRRAWAAAIAGLLAGGLAFAIVNDRPTPYLDGLGCAATASLKRGSVPGGWYDDVVAAAAVSGVPAPILAAQLDQESRWDPHATSHAGAVGLAQFRPDTWSEYGAGGDPLNPHDAIEAQGAYMAHLIESVAPVASSSGVHPVILALAAYNAGPTAVAKYGGVPPYRETEHYVEVIPQIANVTYAAGCR